MSVLQNQLEKVLVLVFFLCLIYDMIDLLFSKKKTHTNWVKISFYLPETLWFTYMLLVRIDFQYIYIVVVYRYKQTFYKCVYIHATMNAISFNYKQKKNYF